MASFLVEREHFEDFATVAAKAGNADGCTAMQPKACTFSGHLFWW